MTLFDKILLELGSPPIFLVTPEQFLFLEGWNPKPDTWGAAGDKYPIVCVVGKQDRKMRRNTLTHEVLHHLFPSRPHWWVEKASQVLAPGGGAGVWSEKYGKTISDVLNMPIEEALTFFEPIPAIARHLQTLMDVGLSYLKLGQAATTLSGGEAQRVKLALELSKRDTGRTLYILDEPTTGLHFHDIDLLLRVLHRLRDHGNTVVVIEHNLDVIKTADWVIDLGPEGGDGGGTIVVEGTPESVAAHAESHTGRYLQAVLK